jgi:RNA polymerase sigma factor (sigma-70 family)
MKTPPPTPDSPHGADVEALARALRGGEDVLGEWYRAEFRAVHRLCQGFLASRSGADDIAQNAMLHLADKLDQWDPARAYASWRNRVVLHVCRDHERAARRRSVHEAGAEWRVGTAPDPVEAAAANEVSALIDRCLTLLPPREREVFVLVDLEAVPASEAAEQLGIAASTVRAALALARRRMRDVLAPMLGEGGSAT